MNMRQKKGPAFGTPSSGPIRQHVLPIYAASRQAATKRIRIGDGDRYEVSVSSGSTALLQTETQIGSVLFGPDGAFVERRWPLESPELRAPGSMLCNDARGPERRRTYSHLRPKNTPTMPDPAQCPN